MYNLLVAEYMKIKKNTALKMVVIGIFVLGVVLAINNIEALGFKLNNDITVLNDKTVLDLFWSALGYGGNFTHISELLSVFGAIYICYDFERKLCHSAIYSGCKKSDIFFSKMIMYFIISSVIFFIYGVISTAITKIAYGDFIQYNSSMIFPMIKMYFICMIYHFARISPIILVAYMVRKTGTTLILWGLLYAGVYQVWDGLSLICKPIDNIFDNTIWMIHHIITPYMTYSAVLHVLLICALYIIISWGGAYMIFKRKELK